MGEYVQLDDYNKKCCMFDSTATYVEEKPGGGQHLNLAAGVSSLFPGQAVWVTTTKDVSFYPFTSTVWKCQDDNASLYNSSSQSTCTMTDLDIHLDLMAFRDGVFNLLTRSFRMLSCCVPYNFPEADPERKEEPGYF